MAEYGILLILGIGILAGILGATLFQKIHFPQVVGYIIIGLIIGQSGMEIISHQNESEFLTLTDFALGIIGFMVGGELHLSTFKKYGRQFVGTLLGEGILAFLLVTCFITSFFKFLTDDWRLSFSVGIIFGAIASATDPASTISVLWEYRSKGILTTSIIAIVALDDALAMTLYGVSTAVSSMLSNSEGSIVHELLHTAKELGGAVFVGLFMGMIFNELLRKMSREKNLVLAIGILLVTIGISKKFEFDGILAAMALGMTLVNKAPKRTEDIFSIFKTLSTPIYVIFFVLVGAKLDISRIPFWLWSAVLIYVSMRCLGKYFGAMLGSRLSKSDPVVCKYLGLSLFAQGGIAIGLSINAAKHLSGEINGMPLSDVLIFGVTASTLLVQFLGPAMTKLTIFKAKENNCNITEEDVISSWAVRDVIEEIDPVCESSPIKAVLERLTEESVFSLPVVDKERKISGIISLDNLKELLTNQSSWQWVLTADVMDKVSETFFLNTPLDEAINDLANMKLQYIPVLNNSDDQKLMGMMNNSRANFMIKSELLKRQG